MSNPITPYFAITSQGNLVYVSEFNDEYANAELKVMHPLIGRRDNGALHFYNTGDVRVVPKWKIGRLTAVSNEVAQNFLTIKLGVEI